MTDLRDIEESIRYTCRHNPMYGEDLISKIQRSFTITNKIDSMIQYLKDEIKRTSVESYRTLCIQELALYERMVKKANEQQIPNEVKHE